MKTEYLLTAESKARLRDIDRRIAELCMEKAEIYLRTPCRYICETPAEIEAIESINRIPTYGIKLCQDKIANITFESKEIDDAT